MAGYGSIVAATAAVLIAVVFYGVPLFLKEYFPYWSLQAQRDAQPTVKTESYKGRTALVTGANGAFGSRAAKIFASRDVETLVLVDVRDCSALKEEIEEEARALNKAPPNILVWQVDLMSYAACQELGRKAKELKNLDHVLSTAGILSFNRRESPEGWETTNALLGLLLLPVLKSSPGNPNPPVLTFVTTFGIYPSSFTMGIPKTGSYLKKLSNNKDGLEQGHQYGRSKALLLYFARELATRASASAKGKGMRKVTINSADPGSAWTGLTNPNKEKLIPRLIMNLGARDPQICATALVNGASSPEDAHGKIMMDFTTASYPPFMERNSGHIAQKRVWDETRAVLEEKVPEVKAIYDLLDAQ
ncbi:hypothetical protein TWF703_001771 [Orbilia oligospora]|uniref:Uncharacterized protein n=1 Tax=Orbilia oligospora TaxID=2813651 RepID=A0A7C8JTH7_ORBOL|nr:hypothetical protein TWF703_001771 [Orbilia oligospora]